MSIVYNNVKKSMIILRFGFIYVQTTPPR